MGIIIYISSNDKFLRNKSSHDQVYGWSFYIACIAFLLSESLGVFAIKDVALRTKNEVRKKFISYFCYL